MRKTMQNSDSTPPPSTQFSHRNSLPSPRFIDDQCKQLDNLSLESAARHDDDKENISSQQSENLNPFEGDAKKELKFDNENRLETNDIVIDPLGQGFSDDFHGHSSSASSQPLGHTNDAKPRKMFNFFNFGKKSFTVYKIQVRLNARDWVLYKRYSEFVDLDSSLRKSFPYLQKVIPSLPPKKIFGDNMDPEFIKTRAQGLHHYLHQLFKSPILVKSEALRNFLSNEKPVSRESDDHDEHVPSSTQSSSSASGSSTRSDPHQSSTRQHGVEKRKPEITFSTPIDSQSGLPTMKSCIKKSDNALQRTFKKVGWRKTIMETKSTSPYPDICAQAAPSNESYSSECDNSTQMTIDDFHLLKLIGKGNFGKVMMAQHKETHEVFAIKVISKSSVKKRSHKKDGKTGGYPHDIDHIMAERNVLIRSVDHPFLIGLRWAFQSKEKLYFVTDYVNGGELFFHLQKERRFSELRTRFYAAEIISALEYLHIDVDVVYRDLKPENILLDQAGHIKLTDFGLAKENFHEKSRGKTQTFCGTPEYLAPEVLRKEPYGFSVDWWCLGSVIYEMLIGLPPFYTKDAQEMYEKILHEKLKFPPYVSIRARSLISGLLHRSPYFRLGTGQNGTSNPDSVKSHLFFEGLDWDKLYKKEYTPPFVPVVSHLYDLRNIDPQFVNEPIPKSVVDDALLSPNDNEFAISVGEVSAETAETGRTFEGFTFLGQKKEWLR